MEYLASDEEVAGVRPTTVLANCLNRPCLHMAVKSKHTNDRGGPAVGSASSDMDEAAGESREAGGGSDGGEVRNWRDDSVRCFGHPQQFAPFVPTKCTRANE